MYDRMQHFFLFDEVMNLCFIAYCRKKWDHNYCNSYFLELAELLKREEASNSSSGFSSFILILIVHKNMLTFFTRSLSHIVKFTCYLNWFDYLATMLIDPGLNLKSFWIRFWLLSKTLTTHVIIERDFPIIFTEEAAGD